MDQRVSHSAGKSRTGRKATTPIEQSFVSIRVLTLATLIRRSATLRYRNLFELSGVDWSVLAVVGQHAPLSLNQLAELINLDRGQLSRGITSLVARGILDRRQSARGGREIQIALSAKGRALYAQFNREAAARNAVLLSGLDDKAVRSLFQSLDRITLNARQMLDDEQRMRTDGSQTRAAEKTGSRGLVAPRSTSRVSRRTKGT